VAKRPHDVIIFLALANAAHDSLVPPCLYRRLIVTNKRRHEVRTKLPGLISTGQSFLRCLRNLYGEKIKGDVGTSHMSDNQHMSVAHVGDNVGRTGLQN
jgi:hypothetical protein